MTDPRTVMRSMRVDALLTLTVAIVGYLVAHRALAANYRVAPAIEDLFVACTGRPGWMPDPSVVYRMPEWTAFLDRKIAYFPCETLKGIPLLEVGITWDLQKYFHLALSSWFRIVGPTIDGFISFQSISFAITSALAFLIFRLGIGRLISLACAAAIIFSSSHLAIAGLPIEYSKAPWVLGVVLLSATIVLRDSNRKSLGWVALALGVVAGVGIGFKPDVIAVMPMAILTPLLFVGALKGGELARKATTTLLVVVGVAIGGGAMLYQNFLAPTGSLLPVQVLGGQDWQTESLHAASPLYDYGITWDDSYVTWMINSYGQRVLGKTTISGFFSKEMQDVANHLVLDLWTTLPGDLVLRDFAATIRVLRLNGLSILVALAGLFAVFCANRRHGWFAVFVTVYLSAYVSLVFQLRHIFHLQFISWWLAGVAVQAVVLAGGPIWRTLCDDGAALAWTEVRGRWLMPALTAAFCLAVIVAGAWLVLTAARGYQQARMIQLVEHYQLAPRVVRTVTSTTSSTGDVLMRIDGLSLTDRESGPETVASDYVAVSFTCRAPGAIHVKSRYLPPVVDWSNWNREFSLACGQAGDAATLMMPVYQYGNDYRFDGLVMSQSDAAAVASVSTVPSESGIRLWLDLLVPSDWRTQRWFEVMKSPMAMPV